MNADINGSLKHLNTSYKYFTHDGERLTKEQVKAILEYGQYMGYTHTGELKNSEINRILHELNKI